MPVVVTPHEACGQPRRLHPRHSSTRPGLRERWAVGYVAGPPSARDGAPPCSSSPTTPPIPVPGAPPRRSSGKGCTSSSSASGARRTNRRREMVNGVDVRRLPLRRRRGGVAIYLGQYAAFLLVTFAILAARSLRRRFALVHVHNMPDVLVFSALVPKALGAKVILDLHDPMPELLMTIFGLGPSSLAVRLLKRLERLERGLRGRRRHRQRRVPGALRVAWLPPEKIRVVMNAPDEADLRSSRADVGSAGRGQAVRDHVPRNDRRAERPRSRGDRPRDSSRRTVPDAELRIYGHATPFLDVVMDRRAPERARECASGTLATRAARKSSRRSTTATSGSSPTVAVRFAEIATPTRIFEYLARGKPVIAARGSGRAGLLRRGRVVLLRA